MIKIQNLSKYFGSSIAVNNLSFIVKQGEILGFLGPNGAGKTTTLRILTGYFPPSSGSAKIANFDVTTESLKARRAIGYLPENVPLYLDMRVKEYLHFVAKAKGIASKKIFTEIKQIMNIVGLIEQSGQLIKHLSKGFRQRVGLGQALLGNPPVLILDEPTIGLDPGQIIEIRSLIKKFASVKTVLLSSHILSEITASCSRVVIINQGRLVAEGPPTMLNSENNNTYIVQLGLIELVSIEKIITTLKHINEIGEIYLKNTPNDQNKTCIFQIHVNGNLNIRSKIAQAVIEAGYQIVELMLITPSLEEVFVKLTSETSIHDKMDNEYERI